MATLGLGISCNNCCIMCTEIMPPRKRWDKSTKQVFDFIDNLDDDTEKIGITGGEPTIRKDFLNILDYSKRKRPNTRLFLITNGRMLSYKKFCSDIVERVDEMATEIHGSTKELHDKITRSPGSFEQTFQGIKNVLDTGFKELEIRIVIHKLNYKDLPDMARLISKEFQGIKKVVPFPIDIIGNANLNRDKVMVKMTDIIPYLQEMVDILTENNIQVSLFHTPLCILDKKYWKYSGGKTVEDKRLELDFCKECSVKDKCPGIWKTYAFRMGLDEFNSIK